MNIWLSDRTARVPRTIEKLVDRVVDKIKDTIREEVDIWKRIRDVLDRALMPHPEARGAVLQAIEEEFILRDGG